MNLIQKIFEILSVAARQLNEPVSSNLELSGTALFGKTAQWRNPKTCRGIQTQMCVEIDVGIDIYCYMYYQICLDFLSLIILTKQKV